MHLWLFQVGLLALPNPQLWLEQTVAGKGPLPSLRRVQQAAAKNLGLGSDREAQKWRSQARLRGWVPRLEARFGTDSDLDIRAQQQNINTQRTQGQGFGLDLSLRWQLGELVFNDVELRAHREQLARSAALRLAKEKATRIYFQLAEAIYLGQQEKTLKKQLHIQSLRGLLEVYTGVPLEILSKEE